MFPLKDSAHKGLTLDHKKVREHWSLLFLLHQGAANLTNESRFVQVWPNESAKVAAMKTYYKLIAHILWHIPDIQVYKVFSPYDTGLTQEIYPADSRGYCHTASMGPSTKLLPNFKFDYNAFVYISFHISQITTKWYTHQGHCIA